jgi:hypothetical protein
MNLEEEAKNIHNSNSNLISYEELNNFVYVLQIIEQIRKMKEESFKSKVLKFKHIYIENCKHNIITNVKTIDEIFGDFEK